MFDIQAFQKAIVQGNYFWKKHVLQRMIEREVKQNAVIETLLYGEIIDFLRKYIHAEKNTFSATNQVNSSNVAVLCFLNLLNFRSKICNFSPVKYFRKKSNKGIQ